MSSYYTQGVQYKLQGSQSTYVHQTSINGKSNSQTTALPIQTTTTTSSNSRKRYSTSGNRNNGLYTSSDNCIDDTNNMTAMYSTSKKMHQFSGKSASKRINASSNAFIVQKTATTTTNATPGNNSASSFIEYVNEDEDDDNVTWTTVHQTSQPKINSHLLDHGYGATPQPSFDNDEIACTSTTGKNFNNKSTDGVITSYYKVRSIQHFLHLSFLCWIENQMNWLHF